MGGPATILLALLAAAAEPAGVRDADLRETDCRTMSQEGGKVITVLAPNLHVLTQAAAAGPFRPVLPRGVSAILCRRNSVIPAEHDDEVLALGLPLYLAETRPAGRIGVLEISGGQFRFRMVQGTPLAVEDRLIQARLALFQKRLRPRK